MHCNIEINSFANKRSPGVLYLYGMHIHLLQKILKPVQSLFATLSILRRQCERIIFRYSPFGLYLQEA